MPRNRFCQIIIDEGAKPKDGEVLQGESDEIGYQMKRLGEMTY
ncbi:MAG: hypothetical protein AAF620_00985 [Bacteroidota bacterium]